MRANHTGAAGGAATSEPMPNGAKATMPMSSVAAMNGVPLVPARFIAMFHVAWARAAPAMSRAAITGGTSHAR